MPYIEPPCIELIENTIEGEDHPLDPDDQDDREEEVWGIDANEHELSSIEDAGPLPSGW